MATEAIKASEVVTRAERFARDLAQRLNEVNRRYPSPQFGPEEDRENTARTQESREPVAGPTPDDLIPAFRELFCRHVASQAVIVPDEER